MLRRLHVHEPLLDLTQHYNIKDYLKDKVKRQKLI